MMDESWLELERMAAAATASASDDLAPLQDNIERWQRLFGYSKVEAWQLISEQRQNVTRDRISDDHWALIKEEKEALGYDREAYEHSLQLPEVFKSQSATIPTTESDGGESMLLFRLGGLLDSPEKVTKIAALQRLPIVREGTNERGAVKFCVVDKEAQHKLEEWLAQRAVLQR
ncbi:hypothetical protein FB567DRAFT_511735 [Paraphoma chrysanthemicola]|uniref:Uncharacterized protein n=1 Tax=Paraphoma chrysanthemicola TaxID=798071 RepID=A0A8K0RKX2_9PLEO|nr:hypothetical protein FB567DRAFT_511735 [Paraphoma chrysanthemicola]